MAGFTLRLNPLDGPVPVPARVAAALTREDVRRVMGRAVANVVKENFLRLSGERHRSEAPSFYAQAAASVQLPSFDGGSITVTINQVGIAQRYFGGIITAGSNGSGRKYLTIPAIPAALGRRAGEFDHLRFVFFRPDLAALVSDDRERVTLRGAPRATFEQGRRLVPREDGRLPVVFWLKPSVKQDADPSVLPSEEAMTTAALEAGGSYLAREAARQGGNPS